MKRPAWYHLGWAIIISMVYHTLVAMYDVGIIVHIISVVAIGGHLVMMCIRINEWIEYHRWWN